MLHLMSFENKMILCFVLTVFAVLIVRWEQKMDAKNRAEKEKRGETDHKF